MVPSTLLLSIERGLALGPCTAIIRHAERPPIPQGSWGTELSIRPEGIQASRELGSALGSRLGTLVASPVLRCVETAREVGVGAGRAQPAVETDARLGSPGAHIARVEELGTLFLDRDTRDIVADVLAGVSVPGLRPPRAVAAVLVDLAAALPRQPATVDVCVTHDAIVATLAGGLLGARPELTRAEWPDFLEGVVLAWPGGEPVVVWLGEVGR